MTKSCESRRGAARRTARDQAVVWRPPFTVGALPPPHRCRVWPPPTPDPPNSNPPSPHRRRGARSFDSFFHVNAGFFHSTSFALLVSPNWRSSPAVTWALHLSLGFVFRHPSLVGAREREGVGGERDVYLTHHNFFDCISPFHVHQSQSKICGKDSACTSLYCTYGFDFSLVTPRYSCTCGG